MTIDNTPTIIFGRCPTCACQHRPGWCATAITKFPADRELTNDQVGIITHAARGYIDDVWNICGDRREALKLTSYRLPGDQQPKNLDALSKIARLRASFCWLATVTSTKPDASGMYDLAINIHRPSTSPAATH